MKKNILLISCLFLIGFGVNAQNQKQMASFSQFQQYYNPAFTGFEGSLLKSLYRNQWTGFEDAPKTIAVSGEFNLNDLKSSRKGYQLGNQHYNGYLESISAKNALGITVLHEQFGPSKETQLFLSYGAGIRLSEKMSLRWGTALTYNSNVLDGNSLNVDQENDPKYAHVLGHNNRVGKVDINLGIALSSAKFYLGYALQDATEGKLITTGDDYLNEFYTRKHIAQVGYRTSVSEQLGIIANGIYQYNGEQESTLEGQLKAVYQNLLWVGAGIRNDKAYNLTGGLRLNQLTVQYAYETPIQEARYIHKPTNEVVLTYRLKSLNREKTGDQILIW